MQRSLSDVWAGRPCRAHDDKALLQWADLPPELLSSVVRAASAEDLRSMHLVCKAWRQAVRLYCDTLDVKSVDAGILSSGSFPALRTLRISECTISPHDAKALGSLSGLRRLSLASCAFDRPAGASVLPLVGASRLEKLEMADVSGVAPEEVGVLLEELPVLARLSVTVSSHGGACHSAGGGGGTSQLPMLENLSALTALTSLVVHDYQHRQSMPALEHLSALRRLRAVSLHRVGVTDAACHAVAALPELRSVSLPDAYRVTDHGLRSLCAATGLTRLDLPSNLLHHGAGGLTDFGLERLPALRALRHLDLSGQGGLRAEGLARAVAGLSALTTLRLRGVPLGQDLGGGPGDDGEDFRLQPLGFLSGLVALERLDLGRTGLLAEHLAPLRALPALCWLDLSFNPVTDEGLQLLASGTAAAAAMAAAMAVVTSGHGSRGGGGDVETGDAGMSSSGRSGASHHHRQHQQSSGRRPAAAAGAPATAASAYGNDAGDSSSAAPPPPALARLRHLDVSFCPVTNAGVLPLSGAAPGLRVLLADGCALSTAGVWALLRAHPGLRMWAERKDAGLPRWFNAADALLFAKPQPHARSLRVLHRGEESAGATLLVGAGVAAFFGAYLVAVLLLLAAVLLLPVALLAGLGVCAAATSLLGARWSARGMDRLARVGQACWGALQRGVEADLREAERVAQLDAIV